MKSKEKNKVVSAATSDALFDDALALVRIGDRRGYTALFSAFSRPLAALARSLGAVDPIDVVNRVFVRAFASSDRLAGGRLDFISFLYTVSSFEIEDRLRQQAGEDLDRRATALLSLTRAQRETLCLQVFFGLRAPDVADATGNTVRTVRWLRDRADTSLRTASTGPAEGLLGEPTSDVALAASAPEESSTG